jgi:hypothetical protein
MINFTATPLTDDTEFTAEASSLGWLPGVSRTAIMFDDERFVYYQTDRDREGDVLSWRYMSTTGRIITVFND